MTESVHVRRKTALPNDQIIAVAYQPDGAITYYVHADHVSDEGALALEAILNASRARYHRQWGLPLVAAA